MADEAGDGPAQHLHPVVGRRQQLDDDGFDLGLAAFIAMVEELAR